MRFVIIYETPHLNNCSDVSHLLFFLCKCVKIKIISRLKYEIAGSLLSVDNNSATVCDARWSYSLFLKILRKLRENRKGGICEVKGATLVSQMRNILR